MYQSLIFCVEMSYQLGYLCLNRANIQEYENHGSLVTVDNVCLDRRVCRGRHWSTKWRDNVDPRSPETPKGRMHGTIVGYVDDESGRLIGENAARVYNQVRQNQKAWCVVEWDNGKRSVYPIGAQGLYALAFAG